MRLAGLLDICMGKSGGQVSLSNSGWNCLPADAVTAQDVEFDAVKNTEYIV